MRIVGGALRGRRLEARASPATRPTSDRVREAIASALEARSALVGARVLDLFAGTGALGFEALSRGAASLVAVELERAAVRCISNNAMALGLGERARVLQLDLMGSKAKLVARLAQTELGPFTLVFADPPYTLVQVTADILAALAEHALLAPDAIVVAEHAWGEAPERPASFEQLGTYRYGDTGVAIWRAIAGSAQT
jgi:16S rRNA (guanine966-N2)-methyltransferase